MTSETNGKRVLDAQDVGRLLGCSPWTVQHLHRTGRLPAIKVGRLLKWRPEDVERYVQELQPASSK